ncbi:putative WW domain-binding protein [Helianthus annuus]|nr:putative WW domain-binding protein [Helianthus annuus]
MALNPHLYGNGMPVAFVNEMFVLIRDGIEFEINNIHGSVSSFSSCFARSLILNVDQFVFIRTLRIAYYLGFDHWLLTRF